MANSRLARVALLALFPGLAPAALAQRTIARDEIPPACWSQETVVETKSYELHVLGPAQDAEELGRVLEAAREQFKALFRAAPRGRERVAIHLAPDRASWLECMRAHGVEPPANADFAHYAPDDEQSSHRVLVTTAGMFARETSHGRIAREHELSFTVEAGAPIELELRRSGDEFMVRCGDAEVLVNDVRAPQLGLFVREGPLTIEVLELK